MMSIDPATQKTVAVYPGQSSQEINQVLDQAHQAYRLWHRTSWTTRRPIFLQLASLLRQRVKSYAQQMAQEMGKPLPQGEAEVEKCASVCDYFAQHAEGFLTDTPVATEAVKSYVAFEALGVVLAIMPWNFPFWQVFRAAIPALAAGNALVLKHASNVSGCALAMERLFQEAGLPEGLFRVLLIDSERAGKIIEDPRVMAVTLTGSTQAGRSVAAKAGAWLKKTVLELGGSDPYLILEDADLTRTVETCVASRLINSGQSCIAAKRFIVLKAIYRQFEELFVERMRQQKMGPPWGEGISVGPLAREDLRDSIDQQVQETVRAGARLLLGGTIPSLEGFYYSPTVLTDVPKGSPAYDEEIFGPVAAIIPVSDEAQAIQVANDSPFGLGAALFTRDTARGERLAKDLMVGNCFVNAHVRSDPRLPFGGVKQSGYGRELSIFGIREFVNIKSVLIGKFD